MAALCQRVAALPATLDLTCCGWPARDLLLCLAPGSGGKAGPLRDLSINVATLAAPTLKPLALLPGLIRLSPRARHEGAPLDSCPPFPCFQELSVWDYWGGHLQPTPWDCGGPFLAALAASPARKTLHTVSLRGFVVPSPGLGVAAAAAAPRLTALRRLAIKAAVWCFARGREVALWEESAEDNPLRLAGAPWEDGWE